MWLGTIMWFNVWFIIMPNQNKVMGVTSATPDEVNAARRIAGLASREVYGASFDFSTFPRRAQAQAQGTTPAARRRLTRAS